MVFFATSQRIEHSIGAGRWPIGSSPILRTGSEELFIVEKNQMLDMKLGFTNIPQI